MSERYDKHLLELLSAYLDGELQPAERGELEHLLEQDAGLRSRLEDMRAIAGALQADELPAPPPDLAVRISGALKKEQTPIVAPDHRWRFRSWQAPIAAAATIILAVMIGVVVTRDQLHMPEKAVAGKALGEVSALDELNVEEAEELRTEAAEVLKTGEANVAAGVSEEDTSQQPDLVGSVGSGDSVDSGGLDAADESVLESADSEGRADKTRVLAEAVQPYALNDAPAPSSAPARTPERAPAELATGSGVARDEERLAKSAPAPKKESSARRKARSQKMVFAAAAAPPSKGSTPWTWSPAPTRADATLTKESKDAGTSDATNQLRAIVEELGGELEVVDQELRVFRIVLEESKLDLLRTRLIENGTLESTESIDPLLIRIGRTPR